MAPSRARMTLLSIMLVVSACSNVAEEAGPPITRALLPPLPPDPPVTTTTLPVPAPAPDPAAADRLARTQLQAVLEAAEQLYLEDGTYDAALAEVAERSKVPVVALEEAAVSPGVVYDAFDQRVTLHHLSSSGRWFCADVSAAGTDYGFGDSFRAALTSCTDGVHADGWGDAFSPTGPIESAITGALEALADGLAAGDPAAAYATFDRGGSCPLSELESAWPPGLPLIAIEEFELLGVTVTENGALADVRFGPVANPSWKLTGDGAVWLITGEPCRLFGPVAAELMDAGGQEILESGLYAVRSVFVTRSEFSFTSADLAELDAELVWVPMGDVGFGSLSYAGSEARGLVVTAGSNSVFYCAVESTTAVTVYGRAQTVDEVDTVAGCKANALP